MQSAADLFEESLAWLRDNYGRYRFWAERDIVWTLQTHLNSEISEHSLPFVVFNDFPILPGPKRSLSSDLVLLGPDRLVRVAAEFKYEPSHNRHDIQKQKLPVVFWGKEGVRGDIDRIHRFVSMGKARAAYSVFIDEGGYFRKRPAPADSQWIEWGSGVWVLQCRAIALP